MSHKLYWVIYLIIAASGHAAESAELLASRFAGLPIEDRTRANLPSGREEEVLNALAKDWSIYKGTLLRLNHTPSVNKFFDLYNAQEGMSAQFQNILARSASPYVIDELAPLLYKTDKIAFRSWGEHADSDWGVSATTAGLIGKIIGLAPEFPFSVKEWAKKELAFSPYSPPPPNIIRSARAWWELNQAALLANQFDKVQVLASYTAGVMPEQPAQQLAAPPAAIEPTPEPPAPAPPPPEPTPEPVKSSVAASMPTSAAAPAPAAKTNPAWWIVGLIIVAAAAVFVTRKKKPKA